MKNKSKNHKKNKGANKGKPKRTQNSPQPSKNKGQSAGRKLSPNPSLYGTHAVREAWLNKARQVQNLYITESALGDFEHVLEQGANSELNRPNPMIVDKADLDKALPKGAVHQGIALACSPLPEMEVEDLIIKANAQNAPSTIAILDQVTDPHNVGAILRSASALGLDAVVMQRRHAPELSGVLAKTACGALEHINVAQATNLSRAIEELQAAGYFVIGLDERGDDINTIERSPKTAIILGAEGPGIRRLVKENCDQLARIPMHNTIASINVSNAAAIAFYALSR